MKHSRVGRSTALGGCPGANPARTPPADLGLVSWKGIFGVIITLTSANAY